MTFSEASAPADVSVPARLLLVVLRRTALLVKVPVRDRRSCGGDRGGQGAGERASVLLDQCPEAERAPSEMGKVVPPEQTRDGVALDVARQSLVQMMSRVSPSRAQSV